MIYTFLVWVAFWCWFIFSYQRRYLCALVVAALLRRGNNSAPILWWDDNEAHTAAAIRNRGRYRFIEVDSNDEASVSVYLALDEDGKLVYPPQHD